MRLGISRYLKNKCGLEYCPDEEILITVGVSEAVDLVLRAIINPGDKVIVPVPSYVSYGPVAELAGAKAVYVDTTGDGFKLTPKTLNKAIDKKVKAVVLNYPANPTGVSYTKKELEELSQVMIRHDLLCLSDEVYDDLTYDFSHTPLATLKGMKNRVIYLNGFSKGFAMTGWRVGYACAAKELIAAMTKIHQYTIMCVSITSQMAACEALISGARPVQEMKREYKRRRGFFINGLNNIGLSCQKPQGAFYAFPSIKKFGLSSLEFSRRLLKEKKVAVVPGTAFGKCGEGYLRMSYASSFDNLKEALARIGDFVRAV